MADRGSFGFSPRLDMEQLLSEAQNRWLRPAEICEILRNYQKFHISAESPNRPPSGSLFLFDRKVLRYFRKDGHNWRKKKDGKTVKEAHEKLKVGSIDVLHCYYAHGEDNENFQRRCYWMLEQDLMHIVFVHYLEVKGNRMTSSGNRENNSNSLSGTTSVNIDSTATPSSAFSAQCEDADSGDSRQASSTLKPNLEPQTVAPQIRHQQNDTTMSSYNPTSILGNRDGWTPAPAIGIVSQVHGSRVKESDSQRSVWDASFENPLTGYQNPPYNPLLTQTRPSNTGIMPKMNTEKGSLLVAEHLRNPLQNQINWQIPVQDSLALPKWPIDSHSGIADGPDMALIGQRAQENFGTFSNLIGSRNQLPIESSFQAPFTSIEEAYIPKLGTEELMYEANANQTLPLRKSLLIKEDSLKKVDSFSRWVNSTLGEMEDLQMESSPGSIAWTSVETAAAASSLSPSLPEDQRFTIIDFWPKWTQTDSEVEVIVIGTFLLSPREVTSYSWSCMFGEVEVPAEILVDGVLYCHAPPHQVGQVPFYITCSDRFSCSEVREFDFLPGSTNKLNTSDIYGAFTNEASLHSRFENLLSRISSIQEHHVYENVGEKRIKISRIMLLRDEKESLLKELPVVEAKERLIREEFEDKLYVWLIHKVTEEGKGPNILDEQGQGVLHLAASLGYDWAIKPIIAAGVSINFRDANGWSALHWAAFSGREDTVAVLVSLGADAGALTDPSPELPLGKTAADLAYGNRHRGISGFLAESALTSYLEKLTVDVKDNSSPDLSRAKCVQTVAERTATPMSYGDVPETLSLKDSLTAVLNATQAADRLHQVFRMQSFQRKQMSEFGDNNNDEFDMSDELAVSFAAAKSNKKVGQSNNAVNAAAVQIQKKYRGWKKRKEFLLIRQRVVKIQAHVRGHQVRKQYKAIVWSVGLLEKIILRWRRKGSGLRGFKSDTTTKPAEPVCAATTSQEDDYDFLKEGRKQTEERLQKALTRVKSMAQDPEARAQYRRLLTVVEGIRENEASSSSAMNNSNSNREETTNYNEEDDLIDIDSLLDDDTFMSLAFDENRT